MLVDSYHNKNDDCCQTEQHKGQQRRTVELTVVPQLPELRRKAMLQQQRTHEGRQHNERHGKRRQVSPSLRQQAGSQRIEKLRREDKDSNTQHAIDKHRR